VRVIEWDYSGGYFYAPFDGLVYIKGKPGHRAPGGNCRQTASVSVEVTLDMNARTVEWTRLTQEQNQEEGAGRIIAHLQEGDTTLYPAVLAATVREYFVISRGPIATPTDAICPLPPQPPRHKN
jgi:hypothetical protein